MEREVAPAARPLRGSVRVPGDKSVSHRAVLFAAIAEGTSRLTGVLDSADVRSTIAAVRALGARVETLPASADDGLALEVTGWGASGPAEPAEPIDCGNSGTTARLLLGVLAGWPVGAVLAGDASLSKRPMARVTCPLESMGATFRTVEGGRLPIAVRGGALTGTEYDSPVASAQVKSAILLAGLRAEGRTLVREPAPSRDHTERLLPAFGVPVGREEAVHAAWVDGPVVPRAADVRVPGDPSSAAFLAGAALVVPGSEVTLSGVSANPTRTGFVAVLRRMGAEVAIGDVTGLDGEPVGTLTARFTGGLRGTVVEPGEVPSLVDEVPLLAVVAAFAEGPTRFLGVSELRVKESDRLEALRSGLSALGVRVRAGDDWLEVEGAARPGGASLDSLGDHRLAMAYAVAALGGIAPVRIARYEAVDVSYPAFDVHLAALGVAR